MFYVVITRMIKRDDEAEIKQLLEEFPSVGVLGPRQGRQNHFS
jgi:hypothetical protein